MSTPNGFSRRVLLCVTGLSPQVVTETLYALAVGRPAADRFVPTELRVLTTSEGRQHALLSLLDRTAGAFHAICRDFRLRGIRFDETMIETIRSASGAPLGDIQTPEDNTRAADAITAMIRQITADDDCALHVSLAGGRKTMGFYAGYALSLFARAQDRLSHVLVNHPFDLIRQFYYPPPQAVVLRDPSGRPIRSDEAVITLAEIPIVRLGNGLPRTLAKGTASFSEAVRATELALRTPRLEFGTEGRIVRFGDGRDGGTEVELPDQLFAFYLWLARRRKALDEGDGFVPVGKAMPCPEDFIRTYRNTFGRMSVDERTIALLRADGTRDTDRGVEPPRVSWFRQKRSKLNGALEEALGVGAAPYLVAATGPRNAKRCGLGIHPDNIRIPPTL